MRVAALCFCALLSSLFTDASLAGQIVFSDPIFEDSDWTAEKIVDTSSGETSTFTAMQVPDGGDPGSYRQVTLNFDGGEIVVAHLHNNWVYTPSSHGRIDSFDFSYRLRRESGQGVRYRLIVEQDGAFYSSSAGDIISSASWTPFTHASQTSADFVDPSGVGMGEPDFSESGGPIHFGYHSSNCCSASTTSGIDNFVVTLDTTPISCQIDPPLLDFGEVLVGSSSQRSFVLTNVSGDQLTGDISEDCSDFSIVSGEGPYSLAPGEEITATVEFAPTAEGVYSCIIDTGCIGVPCEGVGPHQPGVITVAPDGSGDFTTIQAAVNVAVENDTVLVHPGLYNENVELQGVDIVLSSVAGSGVTTIFGAIGSSPVVWVHNGESLATTISGFTITGASGSDGVICDEAAATFEECVVRNNADEGFTVIDGSLNVFQCTVLENGGDQTGSSGIAALSSNLVVAGCTVVSNAKGIHSDGSNSTVARTIVAHSVHSGLSNLNGSTVVSSCNDVWDNSVDYDGVPPGATDFSMDPHFCDPLADDFSLYSDSPCLPGNHPGGHECGLIGAQREGCLSAPDLVPVGIDCAPVASDSVIVSGTFENAGIASAPAFQVRMEVTGCNPLWVDTQQVSGLLPGETGVIELGPIPTTSLPCSATLRVDTGDQVVESDETNNDLEEPTCFFAELDPIAISCEQYAPLSDSIVVKGVFENSGSVATGSFAVRMEIQGCIGFIGDVQVFGSMQPGERDTMLVGPFPSTGELCSVSLIVDVNDDVLEIDESDNTLALEVACTTVEVTSPQEAVFVPPGLAVRPNPATHNVLIVPVGSWGRSTLTVFDLAGRVVRRFAPIASGGPVTWDVTNDAGVRVAPGVYFVRLKSSHVVKTTRLLLLR